MLGNVKHSVFLHGFDDGLKIVLTRWHVFHNEAVFDALAVRRGIAHTESVVQPGTKSVFTNVFLVFYKVAVFSTVLIDDTDTEHIPDDITPVVKSALRNVHTSADFVTEP